MSKIDKAWFWWLGFILVLGLFLFTHLLQDDELDPDAVKWRAYFAQPTQLDDNAHLALIGLSYDATSKSERFAAGKRSYVQALADAEHDTGESFDSALKYPQIEELTILDNHELMCDLHEQVCLELLGENRPEIEKLLEQYRPLLTQYLELSEYANFAFINAFVSDPNMVQLMTINRLLALDIYLAIQDQNVALAASMLVKKLSIDRRFAHDSPEIGFYIMPIVWSEIFYAPLVLMLLETKFDDWSALNEALQPLTVEDISMNKFWLGEFAYWSKYIEFEYIVGKQDTPSVLKGLTGRFLYKENMTINSMYFSAKNNLLAQGTEKDSLLQVMKALESEQDERNEQLSADGDNLTLYALKNYRNIIGAIMALTGSPRIINLYEDAVSYDLRMHLLRLKIAASKHSLDAVLNAPSFINPYNGQRPTQQGEQVCYQMSELLCL